MRQKKAETTYSMHMRGVTGARHSSIDVSSLELGELVVLGANAWKICVSEAFLIGISRS